MLSGKHIFIPTKPRWKVWLASQKLGALLKTDNHSVQPHMALTIDVRFNYTLDRFIVFEATYRNAAPLAANLTEDGFVSRFL